MRQKYMILLTVVLFMCVFFASCDFELRPYDYYVKKINDYPNTVWKTEDGKITLCVAKEEEESLLFYVTIFEANGTKEYIGYGKFLITFYNKGDVDFDKLCENPHDYDFSNVEEVAWWRDNSFDWQLSEGMAVFKVEESNHFEEGKELTFYKQETGDGSPETGQRQGTVPCLHNMNTWNSHKHRCLFLYK